MSKAKLGQRFGRPDLERVGLFSELPYHSDTKHTLTGKKIQLKPRNIMCEGRKTKDATQRGYFQSTYQRIFSKEAILSTSQKKKSKFKNVSTKPFVPVGNSKLHSTPGDYYGTFSGVIQAFGRTEKKQPKFKHELRNLYTSPGKKGEAIYIGLSAYPEHRPDPYDPKRKHKEYGKILDGVMLTTIYPEPCFDKFPFREAERMGPGPTYVKPKDDKMKNLSPGYLVPTGKAKMQGGCHAGCFDRFPVHMPDRGHVRRKPRHEGVWHPPLLSPRKNYTTSIVTLNVNFRVNQRTYQTIQPSYTKYLGQN